MLNTILGERWMTTGGKSKKKKVCRAGNEKGKGKKEKMSLKYFRVSRGDLDLSVSLASPLLCLGDSRDPLY